MFAATSPSERPTAPLPRSQGELRITYAARDGVTRHREAYQQGAMRVRFPNVAAQTPPEAVIINTSGGLTGGDTVKVNVTTEAGAHGMVTSQACERIYRSSGGEAQLETHLRLKGSSMLEWLPQPTILFNHGRLRRMTRVDMDAASTLLAVEGIVFGRTAMQEEVQEGWVEDGWRVRRGGRLAFADTLRLTGDIAEQLRSRAVMAGNRATASILYVAPDAEARLDDMRAAISGCGAMAAASAWDGLMAARVVAKTGGALTQALIHILETFRHRPMPRVWTF